MTTTIDNEFETGTTTAGDSQGGRLSGATGKLREKVSGVRSRAGEAYSSARERTSSAYGSTRERASQARRSTADGIESSPGIALIGGLAIGALAAALLPKSRREQELLGNYGRQINERAREAARAAKEAGRGKLDELGLNKDAAKQTLTDVASKAKEAAKTSAQAAAQTAKSGGSGGSQQSSQQGLGGSASTSSLETVGGAGGGTAQPM